MGRPGISSRTISIGRNAFDSEVTAMTASTVGGPEYLWSAEYLWSGAVARQARGGARAPMGPADMVALARRRHRARQTHPGKRGRS